MLDKPLTDEEIQNIKERCNKATPGPWWWNVNVTTGFSGGLQTTHSGQYHVMHFERVGFHDAGPSFQKFEKYEGPVHQRHSMGMQKPKVFLKPRAAHHPTFELDIDHPDAQFIAHSAEDIPRLLATIDSLKAKISELEGK